MTHPDQQRLGDNLSRVRQRCAEAAERSGRTAECVTLVAICKYVDAETTRALLHEGCNEIGENRPQQLHTKADSLSDEDVRWHMVGHLQRNKVRRVLPHIGLLHSADSLRLLNTLNTESARLTSELPVLLEVNTSGDSNKHGFSPEEMPALLERLKDFENLQVRGLMTMASLDGGLKTARENFRQLRTIRDDLQERTGGELDLPDLSMGMSGDFEIAIEEGATIVRVGSALFDGIGRG